MGRLLLVSLPVRFYKFLHWPWIFLGKFMKSWFPLFSHPPSPTPATFPVSSRAGWQDRLIRLTVVGQVCLSTAPWPSSTSHRLHFCLLEVAAASDLHYLVSGFRGPIWSTWFQQAAPSVLIYFPHNAYFIETVTTMASLYFFLLLYNTGPQT